MKTVINYAAFIVLLFISNAIRAQGQYFISGKVVDETGKAAGGATVFISGSQKITTTNNEGRFIFSSIDAGTYQLTVQLLGYSPYTKGIIIQQKSAEVDISLTTKPILLKTVKIGGDGNRAKNLEIFKAQFLGSTINGKQCQILNPEVINFGTLNKKLTAEADEFLIIENKQLGYRIRYLLTAFQFNPASGVASYDGEPIFEPLEGTDKQKAIWEKNRQNTYNGSLMHFLRAVYTNTTLQEGFVTNQLYLLKGGYGKSLYLDPRPVKFDTIVSVIDTTFIAAKFSSLYIDYNKTKAAAMLNGANIGTIQKRFEMGQTGSVLNLYLSEAIIDRRGNYVDYRTFLRQGAWGRSRIGDQLPFEYEPIDLAN